MSFHRNGDGKKPVITLEKGFFSISLANPVFFKNHTCTILYNTTRDNENVVNND